MCCMQTYCEGFDQRTFFCCHVFRQFEAHICRECNVIFVTALYGRCSQEYYIGTQIVSAGFTEFTLTACDTGFQSYFIANSQICYAFTQFYNNAACFMTQHQFAVNHEVTASAVFEVMYVRTTDTNIFYFNQNFTCFRFGNCCFTNFHFVQTYHICLSIFHIESPHFHLIKIPSTDLFFQQISYISSYQFWFDFAIFSTLTNEKILIKKQEVPPPAEPKMVPLNC